MFMSNTVVKAYMPRGMQGVKRVFKTYGKGLFVMHAGVEPVAYMGGMTWVIPTLADN